MRKLIDYITGQRWAVFVTTVTALLVNLPAIVEAVQGQIDDAGGKVEPLSLLVFLAGFVIQRKVWAARTVASSDQTNKVALQSLAVAKRDVDLQLLDLKARELAASAVLDAARKGLPLPMVYLPEQPEKANEVP